jgi:2,5-diamino-6-(ribosylamino)-4(3H)-pyrimidinone 5'-phosphate reductase
MLPYVILHTGVSVDGRMDWDLPAGFAPDSPYYEVVASFQADVDLAGSATMAVANLPADPQTAFAGFYEQWMNSPRRPLLTVVDSRGRIRNWDLIRKQPWWRGCVALCSETTPKDHLSYLRDLNIEVIIAGQERVDLRQALEELNARYGARVVRTDCGGILQGVLLRAGLVDEVSVIVNPLLIGGLTPRGMFVASDLTSAEGLIPLKLLQVEKRNDEFVWLR